MKNLVKKLAVELDLNEVNVQNSINLLFEEECTIPFVARYRKEITGSMDEVKLRELRDRYSYLLELETIKARYLKVVEEHCKDKPELAEKLPALRLKFQNSQTKQELEDLYLPFKPKRRTRAQLAKEKGLEPLLKKILDGRRELEDLSALAAEFVSPKDQDIDPKLLVATPEDALNGAADILAERIHEDATYRGLVRSISQKTGFLASSKWEGDRKSTRLNSSHSQQSRMPSSA